MAAEAEVRFLGRDKDLIRALDRIDARMGRWASRSKKLIAGVVAAFSARAVKDFGKNALDAASTQIEAQTRLGSVLNSTGNAAGRTRKEIEELAAGLQDVTKFGDEVTISAAAVQASFTKIRGDIFDEAIVSAMDMATVMGGDLQQSVTRISKALQDPARRIGELREAGISFTDAQQEMIKRLAETGREVEAQRMILAALQEQFGGAAEAIGGTFPGRLARLRNQFGDLSERIGESLLPVLERMMPTFEAWGDAFDAAIDKIQMGVATGMASLQIFFEEWQSGWEYTVNAAQLAAVGFWQGLKHNLTVVIPEYLSFFYENWRDVFSDLGNFLLTVLKNMSANIVGFVIEVTELLSGDGQFDFEWIGLTEGFERTLKKLPQIAERELTATEKALMEANAEIAERVGRRFNEIYAEEIAKFDTNFRVPDLGNSPSRNPLRNFDITGALGNIPNIGEALRNGIAGIGQSLLATDPANPSGPGSRGPESIEGLFNRIQGSAAQSKQLEVAENQLREQVAQTVIQAKVQSGIEDVGKKIGNFLVGVSNQTARFAR